MKLARIFSLSLFAVILAGCVSADVAVCGDVSVQAGACVAVGEPAAAKPEDFFVRRSLLCRQAFTEALTNLAAVTGRDASALRGATIDGIDERLTNGVYALKLNVVWSPERETAAGAWLSKDAAAGKRASLNQARLEKVAGITEWIGPKQIVDEKGGIHFLGFSAMAVGSNAMRSRMNIQRATIEARGMAARPFLGKDDKIKDAKCRFRRIYESRTKHPLCPEVEMYVCGFELESIELPPQTKAEVGTIVSKKEKSDETHK